MFGFFFTDASEAPLNFDKVNACDQERFNQFFHLALKEGLYFAPSAFEASFVSMADDEQLMAQVTIKLENVFKALVA